MRGLDLPFGTVRTNGADELKILVFLNSLAGGGTERVAATLANFWARKQWNVTIVTLNPDSDDFYRLDPLVNRISLDLAGQSGGILDALRQNGRRIAALRRVIKEVRPAVALSMMSTPNVLRAVNDSVPSSAPTSIVISGKVESASVPRAAVVWLSEIL